MSQHLHPQYIESCYRCELSREANREYEASTPTTNEVAELFIEEAPIPEVELKRFFRWYAAVEALAASEALHEAAQLLESEAAEQWRLDRGEGMPGRISKPGAQMIAQKLDQLARILRGRAREEQK